MPIKGLTDRGLAFPEIGQIRKGAPKDKEGKLGKDLNYFRVEFDEAETEAEKIFSQKYGKEPKEINILLAFNEIERVWDAWYEAYTAGRMVARADGEKFVYKIDTTNNVVVVKDGVPHVPYREGMPVGTYTDSKGKEQNIYCKPVGRLRVVIPELQRFAYLTLITTSKHDIANISAQLEALKQVNGESIAGVPLVLRRRPKKISCPKQDGSRARYTKYMLSIEADPRWVRAKLSEVQRLALPGSGDDVLLPNENEEEEIEIEQEEYQDYVEDEYDEDDIPGGAEEAQEEAHQKQKPIGKQRPYNPEMLKACIATVAERHANETASEGQRGLMVSGLNTCYAGNDADMKRREALQFLTGIAMSQKLLEEKPAYLLAILDWLHLTRDSGGAYIPDEMAVKEAQILLTVARKEASQEELFGGKEK